MYEELFHLKKDSLKVSNLADNQEYNEMLTQMCERWVTAIQQARGEGEPKVLRYTAELGTRSPSGYFSCLFGFGEGWKYAD
ncbi:MAG: hypothetical protein ACFB15_07545 [Cyclobacteriaceae bacterium]